MYEALKATFLLKCSAAFDELSGKLDVTLERSKIVKLAVNWVATTPSDAIK
jgi:hypothetical protein